MAPWTGPASAAQPQARKRRLKMGEAANPPPPAAAAAPGGGGGSLLPQLPRAAPEPRRRRRKGLESAQVPECAAAAAAVFEAMEAERGTLQRAGPQKW